MAIHKSFNPNLSINIKDIAAAIKNHLGMVIFLVLLILFIGEGLVLKHSVDLIVSFKPVSQPVQATKGVRVNFTNYDAVTNLIDSAASYQAPTEQIPNPFSTANPSAQ